MKISIHGHKYPCFNYLRSYWGIGTAFISGRDGVGRKVFSRYLYAMPALAIVRYIGASLKHENQLDAQKIETVRISISHIFLHFPWAPQS